MTTLPQIWRTLKKEMPNGWISLGEIYDIIKRNIRLDDEDYEPQAPNSDIPKWQRNVRNVLQYRKSTGEIRWDRNANYMM